MPTDNDYTKRSRISSAVVEPGLAVVEPKEPVKKIRKKAPYVHPGVKETPLEIEDCQKCGFWVLEGWANGHTIQLDIWKVPYAHALIVSRYAPGWLYTVYGYGSMKADAWWPGEDNGRAILMQHTCGNCWWQWQGPGHWVDGEWKLLT